MNILEKIDDFLDEERYSKLEREYPAELAHKYLLKYKSPIVAKKYVKKLLNSYEKTNPQKSEKLKQIISIFDDLIQNDNEDSKDINKLEIIKSTKNKKNELDPDRYDILYDGKKIGYGLRGINKGGYRGDTGFGWTLNYRGASTGGSKAGDPNHYGRIKSKNINEIKKEIFKNLSYLHLKY